MAPKRPDAGLNPQARQLLQGALQLHGAGQLDGAAKLYQQILGLHPEHGPTLNFLGLLHHQAGQAAAALGFVERAIAADRRDPSFHVCHAQILIALSRREDALDACERALKLEPNQIDALNQRGVLLIQLGRAAEARAPLERATRLQPTNAALHANLGELLRTLGDLDAALAACRTAVTLQPQLAEAHLLLANVLRDRVDLDGALASFDAALRLNPRLAAAHHNRATVLRGQGKLQDALDGFRAALALDPDGVDHKTAIGGCLVEITEGRFDAAFEADLARALREAWMRPERLAFRALQMLRRDPAIVALLAWSEADGAGAVPAAALANPLLAALLESSIVPDPAFERLLTRLRALLLAAASGAGTWPAPDDAFAAGLAAQCFENDYAFAQTDDEAARVAALATTIAGALAAGQQPAALAVAALASYRPLHREPVADALMAQRWSPPLARLLQRQVGEPQQEALLRDAIQPLTAIGEGVSRAVRAQYEENPYPRWTRMPLGGSPLPLGVRLAQAFPRLADGLKNFPAQPRILVAGCGTGWAPIDSAQGYAGATLLAVDLSLTSLAYALRKTREIGLATIEYRHADILALGSLRERFDLIECVGVLHHMADPLAGWRVLCGLLAPHGFMRISLYSELGRRHVVAARALIAERGYAADAEGIRRARAEILAMPRDGLMGSLANTTDFYSLSGCRDLLFHIQEHRFTVPRIAAALDALGLELVGIEPRDPRVPQRYHAAHPDDPDMVDLTRWAAFEEAHPDTFGAMYDLVLRHRR